MSFVFEVVVPLGLVTTKYPVLEPAGTVNVIVVAVLVKEGILTPLSITLVTPRSVVPRIVTFFPTCCLATDNEEIRGAGTVTRPLEIAVPLGVVTTKVPVVAATGIVTTTAVAFLLTIVSERPFSLTEEVFKRFVPLIVTL